MKRRHCLATAGLALAVACAHADPVPLKSGIEFQGKDVQALQADAFANPGMLWVERGAALWKERCEQCHGAGESMQGVAARYPRYSAELKRVVDLEGRIVAHVRALEWESPELLSLSAFVAHQSRGMAIVPDTSVEARATLERGRTLYFERQGQLNMACTNCHDASWGHTLLAERISQGHPADWPAYRLDWQALGSLSRRLRACYYGVRAEMPAFGSPDLVAIELYLAQRARGLATNAPGVRR
jgi:sulfur-oxidizing protein SoxA